MDQNPPPPPPPSSPPPGYGMRGPASSGARPGMVTGAAVLLFIVGALNALLGLVLLTATSVTGLGHFVGFISIVIGAAAIYAGMQVLALKERGRILGIVLAAIGAVFQILSISRAGGPSIIGLGIDGFIIWALVSNAQYFTP